MSIQPVPPARLNPAQRQQLLFTPGPRLGWIFQDRRELAAPYPEPRPGPQAIQARAAARAADAEQAWQRAWKWAGKPSIGLALVLVLLAACSKTVAGSLNLGATTAAVAVLCCPGLGYTGWRWLKRDQASDVPAEEEYQQAVAEWSQRADEHEAAELTRLAGQPEWGSAVTPGRRTDIFGGTSTGWQALLAVHGASVLAARPLLVADLTGQHAAGILTAMTQDMRIQAATWRLPHDLGRCGLIAELPPARLAEAIAEALHAGTPVGARTDRAVDVRVLQQLASALTPRGVTLRRLATAVRAALGNPVPGGILNAEELEAIEGDLFAPGYRQQVTGNLVRLDAVLSDLAAYAGDGWPAQPARYTCLAIDPGARSASGEILTALLVQWLTVQVSAATANAPAVIVVGADEITRPHAERLADACDARGIPLTLMFRHLRDDTAGLLGGGTTAFMRLGNHAEAEQAAAYLGRRHTFVVSSFTATRGGNQASTAGGSDGYGTSDSTSTARTRGWQGGGFFGTGDSSGGRTRTSDTGTSRNWSTSWSQADGTNWSDTETTQRVYEYAVEPTVLQNLPDCALLHADRSDSTLRLHAVECDPSIITLPGASTTPLPPPVNAAGQYQTGWPDPAAPEPPQSAQPGEPLELPWWQRNQPPGQQP
jgi:hypothetical protein